MNHAILLLFLAFPAVAGAEQRPRSDTESVPIRLHGSALAQLINELWGKEISFPEAKVISAINPGTFVVQSTAPLAPMPGKLGRAVVLVTGGTLLVDSAMLVGTTVLVTGIAQSVLATQATREVPWPAELTPDLVRRHGIRTVILASSVQTADGVHLLMRHGIDELEDGAAR